MWLLVVAVCGAGVAHGAADDGHLAQALRPGALLPLLGSLSPLFSPENMP